MNATTTKQNSKNYVTISNRIDRLARRVTTVRARILAAGQNVPARLQARYELAFKNLFEASLYRYVGGKIVPGAVGRTLISQVHDVDADLSGVLLRVIDKWDGHRPFLNFFRVAAKNAVRDSHRKRVVPPGETGEATKNGSTRFQGRRIVSLEAWMPVALDCGHTDNPESIVDSAHRLRAAMTALFDSSPADTAFLWILHHHAGLTYEQIAERLNRALTEWADADETVGCMIPFYSAACLRKRMERLYSSVGSAIQSDSVRKEAIEAFLESESPSSIGLLSEARIDEMIDDARDNLLKMETKMAVVAETVDAYARARHLRRMLEESLSQQSRSLAMGRIPSFAFESDFWKRTLPVASYISVLNNETALERIREYLESRSDVQRVIQESESDHLSIFAAIAAA